MIIDSTATISLLDAGNPKNINMPQSSFKEISPEFTEESFDFNGRNVKFLQTSVGREGPILPHSYYSVNFDLFYKRFSKVVKNNTICIDVGCSNGDTTIPLSLLNPDGKILAFECNPYLYNEQLLQNISLNNITNVYPFNVALMEEDGEQVFNYDKDQMNGGPIKYTSLLQGYPTQKTVQCRNFLKNYGHLLTKSISFVKSDTEGFDIEILTTFIDRLKQDRTIIQVEWFGPSQLNIYNFCIAYGYLPLDQDSFTPVRDLGRYTKLDLILYPNY